MNLIVFACTTFCQSKHVIGEKGGAWRKIINLTHTNKYINSKMEEEKLKTIPTKDVTKVVVDETALLNGFNNHLLIGSF